VPDGAVGHPGTVEVDEQLAAPSVATVVIAQPPRWGLPCAVTGGVPVRALAMLGLGWFQGSKDLLGAETAGTADQPTHFAGGARRAMASTTMVAGAGFTIMSRCR
jgi:hypothetical protein